jgi:hypothetical protein
VLGEGFPAGIPDGGEVGILGPEGGVSLALDGTLDLALGG